MKKIKFYDFNKRPKNPSRFWMWVARTFLINPDLKKRGCTIDKVNMDGLKPPYIMLSTHASELDFKVMINATWPHKVNNVASIETLYDKTEYLMRSVGVVAKRKFISDLHLIRNIRHALQNNRIFNIYPEARYTFDGTTSYLPESLGKLVKLCKVPLVVLNLEGSYIADPQWNRSHKPYNNPVHATMTQIVTQEEINTLSVDEINKRIKDAFVYDDLQYQFDNNIVINDNRRANGLHRLLYKCPCCNVESNMQSEGIYLTCPDCNSKWEMTELGKLKRVDGGKDIFTHIPDWYKWERECVAKEIKEGTYVFDDEVRITTIPNTKGYIKHGMGKFHQDCNGLTLEGRAYGKPFKVVKDASYESVHVEYNLHGKGDCLDVSTNEDSFFFYPTKKNCVTKIALAVEEINKLNK